ncbi:MAG: hypothetical protein EBZ46_06155 [Actinobacteria bacterium]|nr:hypothetical protein [Acidimicrobiia bacterium]NDD61815.1 hypothetical protein [Actinomycetota bacterium]
MRSAIPTWGASIWARVRGLTNRVHKPRRGVPPFGHSTQLHVFVDPDLLQYDEVWAAAGTWNDVFPITPNDIVRASGGAETNLKRG